MEEAHKERTKNGNWNSLLPWERKRGYEQRAVAGMDMDVVKGDEHDASLPLSSNEYDTDDTLTLNRFNSQFRDSPLKIEIVDREDSIRSMAKAVSDLFSLIEKNDGNRNGEFLDYVAGIDCEWRPTGAYAEALLEGPDDNPVALLQICIPAIGKVYLIDTHKVVRANLADTEPMTTNEEILCKTIGTLFGSERMIKVGYGVVMDFRRLAASFPHISAFCNVRSIVELSTLAQRLHPKSVRSLLGSLQRLTKLVLGCNIAKEQQCSNWEARPLTQNQIEYAALDCALPPRLLDQMTEGSGTAKMKEVLRQVTSSWRFRVLDSDQKDAIRLLKANRVVGNTFVVSQSWLQDRGAPAAISLPEEGDNMGAFTDKSGMLRMPAHLVSIADRGEDEDASWKHMSGKSVGKSKGKCIDLLTGDSIPKGANLEYNPRSGFITFKDGIALFVNMPDPSGPYRRMPYPNEWLEGGRMLTWYIRQKDWDDGRSTTARLLLGRGGTCNDNDDSAAEIPSSVVLFTRVGNGEFVCCGNCKASVHEADDTNTNVGSSNKKLAKLNLHLQNWEVMKDMPAFSKILESTKKTRKNDSARMSGPRQRDAFDPVSFRLRLARMVVDGNMIGAFGMALNEAKVSPRERSIANGVSCVKSSFGNSSDPLVLQALDIIDGMLE